MPSSATVAMDRLMRKPNISPRILVSALFGSDPSSGIMLVFTAASPMCMAITDAE